MKRILVPLLASTLLTTGAFAQDSDDPSERKHRRPPPVALEACAAAVEGDSCAFEGRRGETLEGTCQAPQDKPLACRPDGAPPPERLDVQ
ncbi:MAG: hypothetical protein AAFZ58_07885 [Pseudomonadota bacterium]